MPEQTLSGECATIDARMIRLTILTVLGLFAVWIVLGEPEPGVSAPPAERQTVAVEPATEPEPKPEAPIEAVVPAAAVAQTPEQVQTFPGPALRPSPEYAGQTETAEPTPTAELAGAQILYVTGSKVNFRAGPSTSDRVIGALLLGSPVEALGQSEGGWMHLRDAQGREGYMSGQFLSPDRPN